LAQFQTKAGLAVDEMEQDDNISLMLNSTASLGFTSPNIGMGNIQLMGSFSNTWTGGAVDSFQQKASVTASLMNVDTGLKSFDIFLEGFQIEAASTLNIPSGRSALRNNTFLLMFNLHFD